MQDLKYLTIDDLEKLAVNLKEEIETLKPHLPKNSSEKTFASELIKADEDLLNAIEAEVFERTMLGAKTDGGVSS